MTADRCVAHRLGARGAPFIVLDGRHAIPGAIGTNELIAAMSTVWRENHPMPVMAQVEGVCTPNGCDVRATPGG